jgi:hypothetical protein
MEQIDRICTLTGVIFPLESSDISESVFRYKVVPTVSKLGVDFDIEVHVADYKIAGLYSPKTQELGGNNLPTAYGLIISIKQRKLQRPIMYVPYMGGKPNYLRARMKRGSLLIRGELIASVPDGSIAWDLDTSATLETVEIREEV